MLLWTSDDSPRDAAARLARAPDGKRFPRGEYAVSVYQVPSEGQLREEQDGGWARPVEKSVFTLVVGSDGRTEVRDDAVVGVA